ncbi:MAG: prolipoprotein diacylglyceryl transferase, partial [Halomonas sp.]
RKHKLSFLWLMDRLVIVVPLAGAFIRIGNLFNSEIYGRATDVPWAFKFVRDRVIDPVTGMQLEQEIMRQSHAFTLCFDEDIPNFTAFPSGTLLARDAQAGAFKVGETPLHVVFPNARVEIGARAALLVTPVEGSHSKSF